MIAMRPINLTCFIFTAKPQGDGIGLSGAGVEIDGLVSRRSGPISRKLAVCTAV